MPNLTTALPRRTGNLEDDYNRLYNWAVSLTDELKSLLCNLDAGNVGEAGSVKVQNLDASQAKIKDAQIASLTADKLTAGTIDAQEINVVNITADNINTGTLNSDLVEVGTEDKNGKISIYEQVIAFVEKSDDTEIARIYLGRNSNGNYVFFIQNAAQTQGIRMDDNGNITITGNITGASNISITNSVEIGRAVRLYDNSPYELGGVIAVSNNDLTITGSGRRRIDMYGGELLFNGKRVLTTDDLPTTQRG